MRMSCVPSVAGGRVIRVFHQEKDWGRDLGALAVASGEDGCGDSEARGEDTAARHSSQDISGWRAYTRGGSLLFWQLPSCGRQGRG